MASTTIVSGQCRRAPIAGGKIIAWLDRFERELKTDGLTRRDVCAIVSDVVKGKKTELRWVGEERFSGMLLWLACRGDAGDIRRISDGTASLDFHADAYPRGEVDVWLSSGPSPLSPKMGEAVWCRDRRRSPVIAAGSHLPC
jgi:hypothetical protein